MSTPGGAGAWRRRLEPLPAIALGDGLTVHVAAGPFARLRGLAALEDLPGEHGLLLPRTRSVHTFGMRFALDLVWLAKDGSVLAIEGSIGPQAPRDGPQRALRGRGPGGLGPAVRPGRARSRTPTLTRC